LVEVTAISDLHGYQPNLPGGELLLIAGDLTSQDRVDEYKTLTQWLVSCDYEKVIIVGGNHDVRLMRHPEIFEHCEKIIYLNNSGVEVMGLKIWGRPNLPEMEFYPPACAAFVYDPEDDYLGLIDKIPKDIDILVTHCPPLGYLDKSKWADQCGDINLLHAAVERDWYHCLKLWVWGHIHEAYGIYDTAGGHWVNAAVVDVNYQLKNMPWQFTI